jgi:hypothetical protein
MVEDSDEEGDATAKVFEIIDTHFIVIMTTPPAIAKRKIGMCILAVLLCGSLGLWRTTKAAYDSNPDTDLKYYWVIRESGMQTDANKIVTGLERHHTFKETLSFWTGPWAMGQEWPYYRPIPSVLWWMMYQAFGRNGLAAFLAISAISHMAVLFFLLGFFSYFLRNLTMATLSVCLYALGTPHSLFGLATPAYALELWIDHVEIWLSLAYIGTCWCYVKFLREENRKWLYGTVVCFILSIMIKEMAYSWPMMAVLLLWHESKIKKYWSSIITFGAVATTMIIFRFWALNGGGAHFGSNGSWLYRMLAEIGGGSPLALLSRGVGWPLTLSCFALAILWIWKRKPIFQWVFWLALSCVGIGLSLHHSAGFEDPFYYVLLGSAYPWVSAMYTMIWLFLFWRFVLRREQDQIFGWLWVVVTYSVLLAAPITPHGLYLPAIGWGIWLSYGFRDLMKIIARHSGATYFLSQYLPASRAFLISAQR